MAQPAYHPCMKLGAIQLAVALFGVSASLLFMPAASAQRGGGRGGGMSTRGSAMGARGMAIGRPAPALRGGYAARPAFYSGRGNGVRIARRGTYGTHYPIVLGYPYGYGYGLGWGDSGLDNGVYDPGYGDANNAYPDVLTPTGASSPDPGVAPYAPPQRAQPTPLQAAPAPEDAVTLIFKDGRPPLQVHNYALTRTMLYVTDAHHRDIPVADLDLDATQKANQDAGVHFQLPTPN
jgi:hypothetical protein